MHYVKEWYKKYNNSVIGIGLKVIGNDDEGLVPPFIYCFINDKNNTSPLYFVDEFYILIDDVSYYFELVDQTSECSLAWLALDSYKFLEALSEADSISIKIGSITAEIPTKEYKTTIKEAAKVILESEMWYAFPAQVNQYASAYTPIKQ